MTRFNKIAAAVFAAGALSFAAPALADGVTYPRIVGTGENASVEYGPGAQQNIVGGGAVTVRERADGDFEIRHADDGFVQPGRQGVRAVTVGQGDDARTVWVPAGVPVFTAYLTNGFIRG